MVLMRVKKLLLPSQEIINTTNHQTQFFISTNNATAKDGDFEFDKFEVEISIFPKLQNVYNKDKF